MVGGVATRATSDAEPMAAIELVKGVAGRRRITLGADKAYDTANFVLECREENVTPHAAQNITTTRGSRLDGRTTRHAGSAVSLRIRKADRGGLRLDQGGGRSRPGQAARPGSGRRRLRSRPRRLQPAAAAEAPGAAVVSQGGVCPGCTTNAGGNHRTGLKTPGPPANTARAGANTPLEPKPWLSTTILQQPVKARLKSS